MRLDRRALLTGALAGAVASSAAALPPLGPRHAEPDAWIDLWPGEAPGAPASPPVEELHERSQDPTYNDRILLHVRRPRLALFRPARPNGAAVLIMPGGGYSWVVVDKEGYEMARLLAAQGVTAFVLFYRLPGEGWAAGPNVALSDAQRAMRVIRRDSSSHRIDSRRICALGFSAGGHVCADLLARFSASTYARVDAADELSARPDAAAPIYPVVSMSAPFTHAGSRRNLIGEAADAALERAHSPHLHITARAPPCFLLHTEDDASVPVQNSLLLREALRARSVAVETHLFPEGGHGFGLRLARARSVEHWPDLFLAWGRRQRIWS